MLVFQVLNLLPSLENLNLRGNPLCSKLTYEDEVNFRKFTGSYVIVCFIHNEWNIIKVTQTYWKLSSELDTLKNHNNDPINSRKITKMVFIRRKFGKVFL